MKFNKGPHSRPPAHFNKGGESRGGGKSRAPESTQLEVRYLKHLIEQKTPVCVRLRNNEEVHGVVEYYDVSFIRITRRQAPNLFIFKREIKYLYEEGTPGAAASGGPVAPAERAASEGEAGAEE